jgi:hypothetical protein
MLEIDPAIAAPIVTSSAGEMLLRLDQVLLDARFGLPQLVRLPLVRAVAVLTLAIGSGLNTAVFSLVNAVILRPLPYPQPEQLVWIAPYDVSSHLGRAWPLPT